MLQSSPSFPFFVLVGGSLGPFFMWTNGDKTQMSVHVPPSQNMTVVHLKKQQMHDDDDAKVHFFVSKRRMEEELWTINSNLDKSGVLLLPSRWTFDHISVLTTSWTNVGRLNFSLDGWIVFTTRWRVGTKLSQKVVCLLDFFGDVSLLWRHHSLTVQITLQPSTP